MSVFDYNASIVDDDIPPRPESYKKNSFTPPESLEDLFVVYEKK
jgi:hypothetical protein